MMSILTRALCWGDHMTSLRVVDVVGRVVEVSEVDVTPVPQAPSDRVSLHPVFGREAHNVHHRNNTRTQEFQQRDMLPEIHRENIYA